MGPGPRPVNFETLRLALSGGTSEERLRAALASFQLDHPELGPLLSERLAGESSNLVKATLVKALGRLARDQDLDLLSGYLSDPDDRVRANTVEALGYFENPAVGPVVQPMIADSSCRVRGNALLVLGKYQRARVLKGVQQMAVSEDAFQRETAIYVLSRIGGKFGVTRLAAMFPRETRGELRQGIRACLEGLAKRGDALANQALLAVDRALESEALAAEAASQGIPAEGKETVDLPPGMAGSPSPGARKKAPGAEEEVLDRIHPGGLEDWPEAARPPPPSPATFPEDLKSEDHRRRLEAVQAAPDQGEDIYRVLSKLLETEDHDFVIATLVKKVGKVGGPEAFDELLPYLEHEDGRVRANTLEGLAATQADGVREQARLALEDSHPRVRAQAAKILAGSENHQGEALQVLKNMILEGDESGALSALHALESIDASVIFEILELALVQPQPRVRSRVMFALKSLGERNVLAQRLFEKYSAEENFEDEEHVNKLLARMNSRDAETRYLALKKLSLIRSEKVQSRIELATSDASDKVRSLAQALVEDFGKAYKRQGILHSLGLLGLQAVRKGELTVEGGEAILREVDALASSLEAKGEGGEAEASALLSARRELLVSLGEEIYRQTPGLAKGGFRELLDELGRIDGREISAATISATKMQRAVQKVELEKTGEALEDALRAVENSSMDLGSTTPPSTTRAPASQGPESGTRLPQIPRSVLVLLMAFLSIGGVLQYIGSRVQDRFLEFHKAWIYPVDSQSRLEISRVFTYGVTPKGEVFSLATATGTEKWRGSFEGAQWMTILGDDESCFVFTQLDQVLAILGAKGTKRWARPLGGALQPGAVLEDGRLYVPVQTDSSQSSFKALDAESGDPLWSTALEGKVPLGLARTPEGFRFALESEVRTLGLDGSWGPSYTSVRDFLDQGRGAVAGSGVFFLSHEQGVLGVTPAGKIGPEAEMSPPPIHHPYALAEGKLLVLTKKSLVLFEDSLVELDRLDLESEPKSWAVGRDRVFLHLKGSKVQRIRVQGGHFVEDGSVEAGASVQGLFTGGAGVLVSTLTGVEAYPSDSFQ